MITNRTISKLTVTVLRAVLTLLTADELGSARRLVIAFLGVLAALLLALAPATELAWLAAATIGGATSLESTCLSCFFAVPANLKAKMLQHSGAVECLSWSLSIENGSASLIIRTGN